MEARVKPRFELWDSDSANLLGSYDSIPDVLADLDNAFPSAEKKHILPTSCSRSNLVAMMMTRWSC